MKPTREEINNIKKEIESQLHSKLRSEIEILGIEEIVLKDEYINFNTDVADVKAEVNAKSKYGFDKPSSHYNAIKVKFIKTSEEISYYLVYK